MYGKFEEKNRKVERCMSDGIQNGCKWNDCEDWIMIYALRYKWIYAFGDIFKGGQKNTHLKKSVK